jgi:hypothetical protein
VLVGVGRAQQPGRGLAGAHRASDGG